ncbi:MAG: hypothetical protein P8168_15540, partial [Deltaproteobacteria bacterium]
MNDKPQKERAASRIKLSQKDFPQISIESALRIAQAIWDHFAGKGAPPHDIAMAIGMAPTSGTWRNLCGSSIAYGLTEGGYNSNEIILTELGRRIVAPTQEGDDSKAIAEAIMQPRIMSEFLEKYNKAKFPMDNIAGNILVSMGLPKERSEKSLNILKQNGDFAGIIKETKTGPFVAIDSPAIKPKASDEIEIESTKESGFRPDPYRKLTEEDFAKKVSEEATNETHVKEIKVNNRVFISHGKNKQVVKQLKEILTFGKFEPVISVE